MKLALLQSFRLAHAQPDLSLIYQNTVWLFADRIVRAVLTLVVSAWLARYLGAAGYGMYAYAFAIITLFASLATAGFEEIVVRDLVKSPERRSTIMGTTFLLKAACGILAGSLAVGSVCLAHFDEPLIIQLTAIVAASFLLEPFQTLALWFQSQTQAKYTVVAKSGALILINFGKIALLLAHAPIQAFAWAVLVESLLVAGALGAIYRFKGNMIRLWRFSRPYAASLLRECWPLALAGLVGSLYGRLDQLFIRGMLGNEAIGLYSAAIRISEAWTLIPLAIITSTFPSLVATRKDSFALYQLRLQTLCNVITALAIAVALLMTFLATPLVTALFGSTYAPAGPVLAISIWGCVFSAMGMIQSYWYVSEGLTRIALMRTLFCAGLNALLNLLLIPRYGFVGAACATTLTHACNAWALNLLDPRTRPFFFMQLHTFSFKSPRFRWNAPEPTGGYDARSL